MTDQEEKVGRQRLTALIVFQGRLIELETDMTLIYPEGDERHDLAAEQYDDLAEIIDRLEADPLVISIMLLDAVNAVTDAQNSLVESENRVAEAKDTVVEANKLLSTEKDKRDRAAENVVKFDLALTDLRRTP